jgi:hypothetical protein
MRHITLEGLLLGLDDLLTKRQAALKSFLNGAANVALLTSYRDEIKALPAVLRGRPLADELETTDARHDGFGGALWFLTEAYLRLPNVTPAMLLAVKKIRETLIPKLEELSFAFTIQADSAKKRKDKLADLKADLESFPVAGGTLYDWAVAFVTAGVEIDVLLSQRADAKDRAAATSLRSDAVGALNRLRKSLAAELKRDSKLPKDLDEQVFAYFDLLETNAAAAAAEEKKKKAAEKAAKEAKAGAPDAAAEPGSPAGSPPVDPGKPG